MDRSNLSLRSSLLGPSTGSGSGVANTGRVNSSTLNNSTYALRPRSAAAMATVASVLHHQANMAHARGESNVGVSGMMVGLQGTSVRNHHHGVTSKYTSSISALASGSSSSSSSIHSYGSTTAAAASPSSSPSPTASAATITNPSAINESMTHPYGSTNTLSSSSATVTGTVASNTVNAAGTMASSPSPIHPNDTLIQQIEDQWHEYMKSIGSESRTSTSTNITAAANSTSSHLPSSPAPLAQLTSKLQSNGFLNFFEFTSHRQILTIHGPSFDCLYYNPPSQMMGGGGVGAGGGVSTIYRDRADYVHTLGHITHLIFKCVDFALVALQLPLIRLRMVRLKSLTLIANNLHSLWQLDDLSMLVQNGMTPSSSSSSSSSAASAASVSPSFFPSTLESLTLEQNVVTDIRMYRPYMIASMMMTTCGSKQHQPSTMIRWGGSRVFVPSSSSSSASSSSSSSSSYSSSSSSSFHTLDDVSISEKELVEALHIFEVLLSEKKGYNQRIQPQPSPSQPQQQSPLSSSRWFDLLIELSLHHHGGPISLGTAANPIYVGTMPSTPSSSTPSSSSSSPASVPGLPFAPFLRPVIAPPTIRRSCKKTIEEIISRSIHTSNKQRHFSKEWNQMMVSSSSSSSQQQHPTNSNTSNHRMNDPMTHTNTNEVVLLDDIIERTLSMMPTPTPPPTTGTMMNQHRHPISNGVGGVGVHTPSSSSSSSSTSMPTMNSFHFDEDSMRLHDSFASSSPSPSSSASSSSMIHRDKMRLMRAFNASANPTAQLAQQQHQQPSSSSAFSSSAATSVIPSSFSSSSFSSGVSSGLSTHTLAGATRRKRF